MTEPLDILYVIPRPEIGGAERQLLMLMQGLDRARFRPHVICLDGEGSLIRAYAESAGTLHVINRRRGWDIGALLRTVETIRSVRPAIVHTWLHAANLYGGWAARLAGCPHVIVSHRGLAIDPQHGPFRVWQKEALNLYIAQYADRLVANARAVADRMCDQGYDVETTRVVYNGVRDIPALSTSRAQELRNQFGIVDGDVVFVAIARIDPKKDLGTMLRALARTKAIFGGVRLLVVGGGFSDYQRRLDALTTDLGIEANVNFLGFRDDPLNILGIADVSLLSSVTEGLPNAVLESMLLGKPVVATHVGGVPELIEDGINGYLVAPRDVDAFSERMIRFIADPDAGRRMGDAGRLRAVTEFSPEAMVRNTEAIYDEVLGRDPQQTNPAPEMEPDVRRTHVSRLTSQVSQVP